MTTRMVIAFRNDWGEIDLIDKNIMPEITQVVVLIDLLQQANAGNG